MIEYLRLRLQPSASGILKKKLPPRQLFIPELATLLNRVKELVRVAWEADPTDNSPFKPLYDLFDKNLFIEEKDAKLLIEQFKNLSVEKPSLELNRFALLVNGVEQVRQMIHHLPNPASLDTIEIVNNLKKSLQQASLAFAPKPGEKSLVSSAP